MRKIFIFLGVLMLVGCVTNKELEVVTSDKFTNTMTNNSFQVVSNLDSCNGASYVTESYEATLDDIVIDFVNYTSKEDAEKVLANHITSFSVLKSTGASEKNETGKNYHKYVLISNNYYMLSERIDTTLVFSKTKLKNKDALEKILEELGI